MRLSYKFNDSHTVLTVLTKVKITTERTLKRNSCYERILPNFILAESSRIKTNFIFVTNMRKTCDVDGKETTSYIQR